MINCINPFYFFAKNDSINWYCRRLCEKSPATLFPQGNFTVLRERKLYLTTRRRSGSVTQAAPPRGEHEAMEKSNNRSVIKIFKEKKKFFLQPKSWDSVGYLHSRGSFLGVPLQQVPHQGNGLITGMRDEGLQVSRNALGKAKIHSRRELVAFWPICLSKEKMRGWSLGFFFRQKYKSVQGCKVSKMAWQELKLKTNGVKTDVWWKRHY